MLGKRVKMWANNAEVYTEHDVEDLESPTMKTLLETMESGRQVVEFDIDMRGQHQDLDSLRSERDQIKDAIKAAYFGKARAWIMQTETCRIPGSEYVKIKLEEPSNNV